ncbi:HD domain-containing protein [Lapidilactobacillus achengensis]|uniref:HD domain-containing protein n=1 Tax=Lapidilactobacillus achengensis TaxID=2486000 RepID=A0ABW1UQT9_9LACO|nr:HD domain-containing protein [Lapidilactobacillus achengensis]
MTDLASWRDDQEYVAIIENLLRTPQVQKLAEFTQHHYTNRLDHSLRVSYMSYLICKRQRLDYRAAARAGLLHDLFYYDWRTTKFDSGTHAYIHPRIALRNAERLTELSAKEKDIIIKHMFGATLAVPKYRESWVVSLVDDYVAVEEVAKPWRAIAKHRLQKPLRFIRSLV